MVYDGVQKISTYMRCVKVVIAIIGNCYTGWGETSVSEEGCFATYTIILELATVIIIDRVITQYTVTIII